MKNKHIYYGLSVSIISLWGGSYLLDVLTFQHWAHFPILVSCLFGFFGGIIYAIVKYYNI